MRPATGSRTGSTRGSCSPPGGPRGPSFPALPRARSLGTRIAAVGEATARWISDHAGVSVDLTGAGSAAALLQCFPAPSSRNARPVLIPRSALAPDTLPDGLRALGWSVEAVDAYTTTPRGRW